MPDDEKIDYDRRQENLRREASVYESTYIAGGIEARKEEQINSKKKLKEEKLNIAKKLFDAKIDIETIKLSTGLTDIELTKITN